MCLPVLVAVSWRMCLGDFLGENYKALSDGAQCHCDTNKYEGRLNNKTHIWVNRTNRTWEWTESEEQEKQVTSLKFYGWCCPLGTEAKETGYCQRSQKTCLPEDVGCTLEQEPVVWECLRRQKVGRDSEQASLIEGLRQQLTIQRRLEHRELGWRKTKAPKVLVSETDLIVEQDVISLAAR